MASRPPSAGGSSHVVVGAPVVGSAEERGTGGAEKLAGGGTFAGCAPRGTATKPACTEGSSAASPPLLNKCTTPAESPKAIICPLGAAASATRRQLGPACAAKARRCTCAGAPAPGAQIDHDPEFVATTISTGDVSLVVGMNAIWYRRPCIGGAPASCCRCVTRSRRWTGGWIDPGSVPDAEASIRPCTARHDTGRDS